MRLSSPCQAGGNIHVFPEFLGQKMANYNAQVNAGSPSFFFFHKLNLIAAQVFPLIYVFSMAAFRLQRQNQLRQRPYGLQALKYLLCDPLQIKLAESWFRRTRMKTSCDFPGVPVVKNLPCNAGDVSSTPGQGTKVPHTWNN